MYQQKKVQSLEESANWISYNLKRIADQLEQMNGGPQTPRQSQQQSQQESQQKGGYNNRNQNDVPF